MRVSRSWSRLPQLTPMRTGLRYRQAVSIIAANCGSRLLPRPTLPGLMRYLSSASAQAGCAAQQLVAVEVEVADQWARRSPRSAAGRGYAGTAAAASSVFTVTRTSSEPASASSRTWRRRRLDVRRVGVGHRLDDDGHAAADGDGTDADRDGAAARGGHFAFWAAIHWSTVRSRMSSGTAPVARTASWNARMSKRSPSACSARARSSRNFSWPIL